MKLGLSLSYGSNAEALHNTVDLAIAADEIGYDVAWVAEAYGSDAVTVLSTIGARTTRIGLGSGVMQIPGRSPAMTAMTAASLDALSDGRFRLGLGVSGPQVSEGWHGVRFADPLGRTKEYVEVVRAAWKRGRLTYSGQHFTLPLPDGPGKALMLAVHPTSERVPIYLAAIGPKSLDLVGEIADGWLGIFFDSKNGAGKLDQIRGAAERAGRDPGAIDLTVATPVSIADDPAQAANTTRANAALYIGGMGSKRTNFYHRNATEMGYGAEADRIQELFLARDYAGAAAAVPFEFLDRTCLLGTPERIAERLADYRAAGVSTVTLSPTGSTLAERIEALRAVFEAATKAGVLT